MRLHSTALMVSQLQIVRGLFVLLTFKLQVPAAFTCQHPVYIPPSKNLVERDDRVNFTLSDSLFGGTKFYKHLDTNNIPLILGHNGGMFPIQARGRG